MEERFVFEYLPPIKAKPWKLICETKYPELVIKFHPLKQREIAKLLESDALNSVKRLIIFGSSYTRRCSIDSDVDICLEYMNNITDKEIRSTRNSIEDIFEVVDILEFKNITNDPIITREIMKGVWVKGGE